jgi:putative polyketide hydroxylase
MLTTDVLVVGAGPAGLATAVGALRHGARVLVVERRVGTSTIPRAVGLSTRTMELLRTWGLDRRVRAGSVDCLPASSVVRTLVEEPLEVNPPAHGPLRETLAVSPAFPAFVPQDHLEPLLVARVRELGGDVRFGTSLTGLVVTPDGVRAELGAAGPVRARFVVGADGTRSAVRAALGIGVRHLGSLGEHEQLLFRPDLAARLGRRPHVLAFVQHPQAAGVLAPMGSGRWAFVRERPPGVARTGPDEWVALLRTATGLPDLVPQVIGALPFTMAAAVATAYRAGPGFVVGDAAHRMTPMGGLGLNTAVHDGHELGWRLGWVARGLAGDALLDSWAAEREPVGLANARRSLAPEGDPDDGLPRDLGGTYRSAVVLDDGRPPAAGHRRTARPGERAPHAWLRLGGRRRSVLDLFDGHLTVLAGDGDGPWRAAAARLGGVPLRVVGRAEVDDGWDGLARAHRLAPGSVVLVRPDGVVAWRHDGPVADPGAALDRAVATALGRRAPARAAAG